MLLFGGAFPENCNFQWILYQYLFLTEMIMFLPLILNVDLQIHQIRLDKSNGYLLKMMAPPNKKYSF